MRIELDVINGLSVKSVAYDEIKNKLVVDLTNLGGSAVFPFLHVIAIGASGRRRETAIAISGVSGKASVLKVQDDFPFDAKKEVFDDEGDSDEHDSAD